MNILLRNYKDKKYVWKPAVWENYSYYLLEDGVKGHESFSQTAIIDVTDDDRNGYVMCNNCGALIRNTPEAIEAHFAEKEKDKDCTKCRYAVDYGERYEQQTTATPNEDGSFTITGTYKTKLGCKIGWNVREIHHRDAIANCVFAKCRRYGVANISDIFVSHPHAFDKHISVDVLTEKKYICEGYVDGHFEYDLKCRGTVKACVNDLGIVDHFKVSSKGYDYIMYYSARYDKVFFAEWSKYNEDWTSYVSATKHTQILSKMRSLYKEDNTNE